jgi:hypothetical protein
MTTETTTTKKPRAPKTESVKLLQWAKGTVKRPGHENVARLCRTLAALRARRDKLTDKVDVLNVEINRVIDVLRSAAGSS